jgi:toxin-antitoxin system PIN domain toxin
VKTLSASACLFDASAWVALAFSSHPHQAEARREFEMADSAHPAVFCRATQLAFLRILTTPVIQKIYGSGVITNDAAWEKWERLIALPQVVWLDEPYGVEALWQKYARLSSASPKVWMDAYLAAFAITAGLRLATLDRDFKKFELHGLDLLLLDS